MACVAGNHSGSVGVVRGCTTRPHRGWEIVVYGCVHHMQLPINVLLLLVVRT
jgi:hypothetical protein